MRRNACMLIYSGLTMMLAGCTTSRSSDSWDAIRSRALPRHYECRRAAAPLVIDGLMNESAWDGAAWTEPFADIQGGDKPTPPLRTRAKMLWDDEYLYITAELEEPHVWGTLCRHDDIVFYDNDFEIFIDPDGDAEQYYEIEVNALNTIFDLFLVKKYREGGPALHGWDMKEMEHAVFVRGTLNNPSDEDEGWSVEFALPWRWLKEAAHRDSPPRAGDVWRINFSRVEWQTRVTGGRYEKVPNTPEDNWIWSPQGVIDMHLPERWGYVRFVE